MRACLAPRLHTAGNGKCRKWHVTPTTAAPATKPPLVLGGGGGLTCRGRKEGSKGLSNHKGDVAECMATARSLNAITRACNRRYKQDGVTCTADAGSKGGEEGFLSFKGTARDCKQLTKGLQKGIKQYNSGVAKTRTAKFVCKATSEVDVFHIYHKASGRCATEARWVCVVPRPPRPTSIRACARAPSARDHLYGRTRALAGFVSWGSFDVCAAPACAHALPARARLRCGVWAVTACAHGHLPVATALCDVVGGGLVHLLCCRRRYINSLVALHAKGGFAKCTKSPQ